MSAKTTFFTEVGDVAIGLTPTNLDGVTIGANTPEPATVTNLTASGTSSLVGAVSGAGFVAAVEAIAATGGFPTLPTYNTTQIAGLTTTGVMALSSVSDGLVFIDPTTTQQTAVSLAQVQTITGAKTFTGGETVTGGLQTDTLQFSTLTTTGLAALTSISLANLSTTQVAGFTTQHIAALSTTTVLALSQLFLAQFPTV